MPRMIACSARVLPALTILFIIGSACATTLQVRDLRSLTQDADEIVLGSCSGSESRWVGQKIFTDSVIVPTQRLKGAQPAGPSEPVVVTHLGGAVSEPFPLAMVVPGMPRFAQGEEVLLFIHHGRRSAQVLGLDQGKLTVVRDEEGEGRVSLSGVSWYQPMGQVDGRPLDDVLAEIEGYVNEAEAAEQGNQEAGQ